jgi:heme A synthase
MSALWSLAGVALVLSCLVFLAALLKLPPGQNLSPSLRLTFILSSASGIVTSSSSFYHVGVASSQALSALALVLASVALLCMFRAPHRGK